MKKRSAAIILGLFFIMISLSLISAACTQKPIYCQDYNCDGNGAKDNGRLWNRLGTLLVTLSQGVSDSYVTWDKNYDIELKAGDKLGHVGSASIPYLLLDSSKISYASGTFTVPVTLPINKDGYIRFAQGTRAYQAGMIRLDTFECFCIPSIEVCDGIDNDCDTKIDDGVCLCSNGIKESKIGYSENCDDGNFYTNDSCLNNCINAGMGDGYVWIETEECDDGNFVNGDGCNINGTIESGWNCVINTMGGSNCTLIPILCADECSAGDSRLLCSGNNVNKETCGEYDADSCLEYGNSTLNKTCSASQICSNGNCANVPYTAPESCFGYKDSGTCTAFNAGIAKKDVDNYLLSNFGVKSMPSGGFCDTNNLVKSSVLFNGICNYTAINCKCSWEANGTASCGKTYDLKRTCSNSTKSWTDNGKCDISIDVDKSKCGSPGGKITQTFTAKWTSSNPSYTAKEAKCESKTAEYPCPSTQKLPFFGFWSFIISLSLIAVIYSVIKTKIFKNN